MLIACRLVFPVIITQRVHQYFCNNVTQKNDKIHTCFIRIIRLLYFIVLELCAISDTVAKVHICGVSVMKPTCYRRI